MRYWASTTSCLHVVAVVVFMLLLWLSSCCCCGCLHVVDVIVGEEQ